MTPEPTSFAPAISEARAPIGILAAGGALPVEIAAAARASGHPVHIVAFTGIADEGVSAFSHDWASLGQINRILTSFRRAGCREMIIVGAMQRPELLRLRVDAGFFRHLPTVLRLTRGGDDNLLRVVVRFFESEGFIVRGVGDIAPALLPRAGQLGAYSPDARHERATARAARVMAALGRFDIGQAIVATEDRIVAVEGVAGTDAMLAELGPGGSGEGLGAGAVMVKLAKPGQELRVDLPTIGPVTVERAKAAQIAGIAISAGAAIIMEREQTLAAADAAGMILTGVATDPMAESQSHPSDPSPPTPTPLMLHSRRAPTPAERRDISVARRLLPVLASEGAGRGAVVARQHVLAVSGALPIAQMILPLASRRHWGLRAFRGQIGVLALDLSPASGDHAAPPPALDLALFAAVREAKLAGVVCLGATIPEDQRAEITGWANDAKVFLMALEP